MPPVIQAAKIVVMANTAQDSTVYLTLSVITLEITYMSNRSEGRWNMFSRNGIATLALPKRVSSPVPYRDSRSVQLNVSPENQPANRMNTRSITCPAQGRMNRIGTMILAMNVR